MTEKQKNIRIGQAYFLRAWCYFNLFKWYGGVPLVSTVQEPVAGEANNTPRSSAKDTKNFIISDLLNCWLPRPWEAAGAVMTGDV